MVRRPVLPQPALVGVVLVGALAPELVAVVVGALRQHRPLVLGSAHATIITPDDERRAARLRRGRTTRRRVRSLVPYRERTCCAWGPFWPWPTSNSTF